MSALIELFSSGWQWILGAIGIGGALLLTWFTGKKTGSTEAKAKADVEAAQENEKQAQAVTEKQAEIVKVSKNVEQQNNSLGDDAARSRMQQSKYHSTD